MKQYKIAVLPGDGIGPEVLRSSIRVMDAVAQLYRFKLDYRETLFGGMAIDAAGRPLPALTIESCKQADASLIGCVGGPRWEGQSRKLRPEYGILALRSALGLYMNLRPCTIERELQVLSPLRPQRLEGVNCLLVRDLVGLTSYSSRGVQGAKAQNASFDVLAYQEDQVRRIATAAFELARGRRRKLTSVDKANVLSSARLWREVVRSVALDYPDVEIEYVYADSMISRLLLYPGSFDVILTDTLFGDFLSEQLAALEGSTALAASAFLGEPGTGGLFGAIHGTADALVGTGTANPLAAIRSGALLMRWGLNEASAAWSIEHAVQQTLRQGFRTRDLVEENDAEADGLKIVGTDEMTDVVLSNLQHIGSLYHAPSW